MEHKVIVEYNDNYNFYKLTCSEGCLITAWNDGDNIVEYSASEKIYTPHNFDTSIYHCITIEEHKIMIAEQEKVLRGKEERDRQQEV